MIDCLETVLTRLHDANITASVGTAPPAPIVAVLVVGETKVCEAFQPVAGRWPRSMIAEWLLETARQRYPGANL